jgi:hypothetical protein
MEENMTGKLSKLIATATVAVGLAVATAAFAQEGPGATTKPTEQTSTDGSLRMAQMMDGCHRMMESMRHAPATPDKK